MAVNDVLFEVGQDHYDFIYIESGAISIIDRSNDGVVTVVDAGSFVGEIGMLMGQKTFLAGVVSAAGQMIVISYDEIRNLIATVPEIGDIVVGAFAARRKLLMEWSEGGLVIVGDDDDSNAGRLREFAGRNRIPHRWVERADIRAIAELKKRCVLPETGPAVVTGQSRVLADPTPRDLAAAIGLDLMADTDDTFDVIVVGAGPAGLASAVYAASEGLSVVVEDTAIGGQAGTSSRIENYLGFPQGVSGMELAYRGEIQAVKFGARIVAPRRAVGLTVLNEGGFDVDLVDGTCITTRAVILANGFQYRKLPLDRLGDFEGNGIYYAATELEARYCRDTQAVIGGGGNSAGQAAMFVSRYADSTHIVVRGEGLASTMSSYLSTRIDNDDAIRLWTDTEVSRLDGDSSLRAVTLRNRTTGDEETIDTQALFIMIGAAPNTEWLDDQISLDDKGFVLTGRDADDDLDGYMTTLPGVYAVGDIRSGSVKRVASAVGEGSVVVAAVHQYLESLHTKPTSTRRR